jgi:hypothetical protein
MSSKKQQFLDTLLKQIRTFQEAYDSIKNIPDSVFELVYSSVGTGLNGTAIPSLETIAGQDEEPDLSWASSNRGLVLKVIERHNSAIQKKEIISKFRVAYPNLAANAESIVTSALSGLRVHESIRSYNPSATGNVKLGYWTLPSWWDGDNLRAEYRPKVKSPAMV